MAWGLFGWGSGDRGRTPSDADHRDDNGPPAPGDWISTTATSLVSGTPRNTSAFSLGSKVV